jgi:hypothetical protein
METDTWMDKGIDRGIRHRILVSGPSDRRRLRQGCTCPHAWSTLLACQILLKFVLRW